MTLALNHRAATLAVASFNDEEQTVDAVASTFADVQRRDSRGGYIERLNPAGLDATSIVGVPLLGGHRQGSARDVLGIVQSHRIEDGKLIVTLRLSQAADAAPTITRIREGLLRVSIGYSVLRWAESIDSQAKSRVRTAAAWRIQEVSAVPVPADPGATFRSNPMEDELDTITPEQAEAQRRKAIRTICRAAGMTAEQADELIDSSADETAARAAAFDAMQTRRQSSPTIRVVASNDDPAALRVRREEALFARVSGTAPTERAREFMSDSLRDIARASVEAAGISTRGLSPDELFTRAHGTSDFPELLTGVGRRTLMAAYAVAESPLKTKLARAATLQDFRPSSRLKLSDVGPLKPLSEDGEIQHTTRGEVKEGYSLDTYASMFALSRKALINDDLNAFGDWGRTAGRAAAETEANLLVSLLTQGAGKGPQMGEDGKRLFHTDHGNITTGWDLSSLDWLSDGRLAMRRQKSLDGKTPLSVSPKYILARPEDETTIERHIAAIYASTPDDVNPFWNKFELLIEPRLTANAAYLFADPTAFTVLEYAYLSSAPGPQIASQPGWDRLGMEFRVFLDFGAGAVDFRGAHRFEA